MADSCYPELFFLVPKSNMRLLAESKGLLLTHRTIKVRLTSFLCAHDHQGPDRHSDHRTTRLRR